MKLFKYDRTSVGCIFTVFPGTALAAGHQCSLARTRGLDRHLRSRFLRGSTLAPQNLP